MWHNFLFFLQYVKAERFLHCGFGSFGHEAVAEIRIQREKYETSVRKPDVPAVDGFIVRFIEVRRFEFHPSPPFQVRFGLGVAFSWFFLHREVVCLEVAVLVDGLL